MPHRSSLIGSLLVCLCVIVATGWNPKGVAVASLHAAPDRTDLRIDGEPGKLVAVAELTTAEIMNQAVANRDPSLVSPRSQFRARPASSATKAARSIASQASSARDQELVPSLAQTISTPNVDVVTLADTGLVPPDTMGDVGLTQYLVAVNGLVRTFTKATGAPDGRLNTTLDTFFLTVSNGEQTTNPRVRYDRRSGRWYVLAITLAIPNRILLAVSSSDEITNSTSWQFFFSVNTRTSVFVSPLGLPCLADFPTLGVDEDALYVGVNQFCAQPGTAFPLGEGARDSASGYVISKASLFDANPDVAITAFHELSTGTAGPGPYTPQGVDNFDSNTNVGYFIGVDNAALDQLQLVRIFDPAGSPTRSGSIAIPVEPTELPVDVPHPSGIKPLGAQDDRLNQAVIRQGHLWTNHQIEVDAAGEAVVGGGRSAVRWYELQSLDTSPGVRQVGTVFDPSSTTPASYFMGSLTVSGQGHVALGATRAGATEFVNAVATGRLASDPLGQMNGPPQAYSANGSFTYNPSETGTTYSWGGYSYTSVDPTDDMTLWTLQQYVNANNSYALRLVRLQAPPPAQILSVSPLVVVQGHSAVQVTVNGSSAGGAGFFDPGPGVPQRLVAALAGSGITVTGVAVASPTQLTLTLDTTAASLGAHALSISNPDGQTTSLASALTVQENQPPVAAGDAYSVRAFGTLNVPTPGVLGNDSDPNNEPISAVLQTGPAHGALTLNPDGSFTYTPAPGFAGVDGFSYVASDGDLSSGAVTVTLTVIPNLPPSGTPDAYGTPFNTVLNVAAPGVLANDGDPDADPMSAVLVSGSAHGSLTLNPNGSFAFTPATGYAGIDSFVYRVSDGAASSAPVTVTLTINQPTDVQPPTGLYAYSVIGNTVTLRWTAPAVGPAPTNYVLEGGVNPGEVLASIPTNSASPIFTVVAPSGSFYVRIHALTGTQRGAASNEIRIHVNVPVPPSAPAGLVGLANGSTLNLAWRNTFAGGPPSSMLLDVTGAAVATIPLGFSDSFEFAGVPGGTYTLRLRAANGGGTSPPSSPITLTFPAACSGAPEVPENILAYRVGNTAYVLWDPASTGPAPTSFTLTVTGSFTGSFQTRSRALSGAVSSGTYVVNLVASNACGNSVPSGPLSIVVP